MDTIKIFTEEPEQELWRSLLQYSYKANILRYFEDNQVQRTKKDDDTLAHIIAGAILQADEYYKASRTVSLQVEPLLLYYGTTNLLYALAVLSTGIIPDIKNHGIRISTDSVKKHIAETGITFEHFGDGGIHLFSRVLGYRFNLCDYSPWDLGDFLDSIAEIKDDFEHCYCNRESHVLPLHVVNTPNGIVEKIYLTDEEAHSALSKVEDFSNAYLRPERVQRNNDSYFILHRKMNGKEIHKISYSGQPYLQVGHEKSGKSITVYKELNMYVTLFVLGNLCRYHPAIWNPFVTQDSTGEKLLIEKFLYYSRRMLPNFVLNMIMKKQVLFVSDKYTPEDRVHLVGQHEIQEIVSKEVKVQIKSERAKSIIHLKRS